MLPQGKNKVFQSYLTATSAKLSPQQNVEAVQLMEEGMYEVATRKGFVGISASNTSPLTQQLASIYGYRTLVDCQMNKYVYCDLKKPWETAPDSKRVLLQWRSFAEYSEF